MQALLYHELVPWYRLLDPPEDHADEVACFREAFERAASPRPLTLLELGSGAGHNALHLKAHFRCTLADVSEPMLALSRELNPDCEHLAGDMRTLRLGRTFDAVLVHDAVTYMTSAAELLAAARTAFAHTRPGGAAIFAPDCTRETFHEGTALHEGDDGARSLRCLEWTWDPDPGDETYAVEYAFLLRDAAGVRAVHDRHVEGLFSRATWSRALEGAGYRVEPLARPIGEGEFDQIFLCRRP
ncbi:MAG TPA: class I SAM-dependent methyltransferase [Polyangiaceae bacterium]|nr:class I SAM-dependent methyltransferase [Polyangiaceae bacterium]